MYSYGGDAWEDTHSRRVAFYGFFEEMPKGLQRFLALLVAMLPGALALPIVGSAWMLAPTALVSVLSAVFAPAWLARKWQKLGEEGLYASTDSYAFQALKRELAKLVIYIRDMNDRIDHEVGIRHISAYLRLTREPSVLVDRGHLDEERKLALQEAIDQYARGYAVMIRYYFDQRELARQARERGNTEEAARIETAMRERLSANHSARADIWLRNHQLGLLE